MKTRAFWRESDSDSLKCIESLMNTSTGLHRFFRMSGPRMQMRFAELVEHETIPKILIHGNPHVANYCKTLRGAAMVDFDRSRVGPYAYDIVRFLISVSISKKQEGLSWLHPIILEQFRRGYMFGFLSQTTDFEEMSLLRDRAPKKWQKSTNDYLESGKKWARRLFENEVSIGQHHTRMLSDYLSNRNELSLLGPYRLALCAEIAGSMGKLHHLYLLEDRKKRLEPLLIDIKEVYEEPDNEWYHNPFDHHGTRMNVAGELYAPGWELKPGRASYGGQQYWARQIPTQQVKLSVPLSELEQCDLCYAVGSQLGSGHSRAADKATREAIVEDFERRLSEYLVAAAQMREELIRAHAGYVKQVHKRTFSNAAR